MRNAHAERAMSFARSTPTWHVQTTAAPPPARPGIKPAGGGLRDHHDVPATEVRWHLGELRGQNGVVSAPFLRTQGPAIAEGPVEPVVDPFRDLEEVPFGLDHEPAQPDPLRRQIPEVRAQELRDAATVGGRVDVPDGPPIEAFLRLVNQSVVPRRRLAPTHRSELFGWSDADGDFDHRINVSESGRRSRDGSSGSWQDSVHG